MQIYNGSGTRELNSYDFFLVEKNTDRNYLTSLCLRMKKLLEPGESGCPADVNRKVNFDATPLHNAVSCVCAFKPYSKDASRALCVSLLGQAGVDELMADKKERGLVPKDCQDLKISYAELIVEYLCRQGADVNAENGTGKTPIFLARKPEIIYLLRKHGADLTLRGRVVRLGKRNDGIPLATAMYDRIKERNIRAMEALMEYMPLGRNLSPNFFYEKKNKKRFYREGEYIVWLSRDKNKPTVSGVQRFRSNRDAKIMCIQWMKDKRQAV